MFWWRRRKTTADLDDVYGSLLDLVAVMEDIRADLRAIRNVLESKSSEG
jgi:hypothetical protein